MLAKPVVEIAPRTWLISEYKLVNMYLLEGDEAALLVDCGTGIGNAAETVRELTDKPLTVAITHGHFDHIWEADRLHEMLGVPVCAYETEAAFAADDKQNGSLLMMYESITCKVHEAFKDGETFQIGEVPVTVLHTPGHTAGGVSYITPDALFTGDTLMGYSVGRCDLPTGNSAELRESLKKLAALPGNPDICGGHGPVTTLEDEKRRNPYL